MALEEGIVTALQADATVQSLIANSDSPISYRLYHTELPQNVTYPAIRYERANTIRQQGLTGPTGFTEVRLQVDCWSNTVAESKSLAAAVKGVLDGKSGTLGGEAIKASWVDEENDFADIDGDRRDIGVGLDFVFIMDE